MRESRVVNQVIKCWKNVSPPLLSQQSYGVCALGLNKLWLLIVVYGLSASIFSSLSLSLLRLPRWVCLISGAFVHGVLVVVLMAFSPEPNRPKYEGPLLVISALWGLGTALNKTGVSSEYHPWSLCLHVFSYDTWQHEFLCVFQPYSECCTLKKRNAWTLSTPSITGGRQSPSL